MKVTRQIDYFFMPDLLRAGDLQQRIHAVNEKPLLASGRYVLAILHRALRAADNPVLDVAAAQAHSLRVGLLVYSELDETAKYASDRLAYFELGAFRELAQGLAPLGIPCVQTLRKAEASDPLGPLLAEATVVVMDEDFTVWDRRRMARVLGLAPQTVFAVDASRLVPVRQLPAELTTTPAFRKAHTALRDRYTALRQEIPPLAATVKNLKPIAGSALDNFASHTDAALKALVTQCSIDHSLPISTHPPTQAEIQTRIDTLQAQILPRYKWIRNNAALTHSTSQLSPYLHYGMLSPHQLLATVASADMPQAYTWKFRDEFLTWREWSHYQAFHTPNLHEFESLPSKAKQTLLAHASDPRPELCTFEEILQGDTPDETWNAAQREWLHTGWLHNNLRMYWAKQILRFTESPQRAWEVACRLNDALSLDGRDSATYASLQWAFGRSKPGYREQPIYGWVAPKSDRAIVKRSGMKAWIAVRQDTETQLAMDLSG